MHEHGDIIALDGGAWRLQAPLAASSYGVLWSAANAATGLAAALKLVNTDRMREAPEALRRHWRDSAAAELAFLRALQPWDGRHIVRLLDAGEVDGCPALALELLDGDLRALLAARGRPPLSQALEWIGQVNTALARVHQYGWRHLDLKPANLLVDAAGGTLKLADFGTCRRLDDRAAHAHAGTSGWQAPEQCTPGAGDGYRTDARSDYFALGALLYHLVTGERLRPVPAGAGTAAPAPGEAALFLRHAMHAGGCDEAGRAALALLRALLAPRPQDRPRHALDISRMLARARAAGDGNGDAGASRFRSAA
jgi:serine/threonine-protein kinase